MQAQGAAVAGAAMTKRPFSLDIVGPSAGEYSASVVEVRTVERPDRLFAVITFALELGPAVFSPGLRFARCRATEYGYEPWPRADSTAYSNSGRRS